MYRQIAETAPATQRPYAIYLLGVNPPDNVSGMDLATFNDFYTNVHLVEVAERRHALRAVRYELIEEVRLPIWGLPGTLPRMRSTSRRPPIAVTSALPTQRDLRYGSATRHRGGSGIDA